VYSAKAKTQCGNSCGECQRAVYQLKFHGVADCNNSGGCMDTCEKVKEGWSNPFNVYEPFMRDIFGSCEICFRNSFCKISECKEQAKREGEVINRVISNSHLRAKINDELLSDFPNSSKHDNQKSNHQVVEENKNLLKILTEDIKEAVENRNTEEIVPKMQNMLSGYFKDPMSDSPSEYTVLYGDLPEQSAMEISFAGPINEEETNKVRETKNVGDEIAITANKMKDLKKEEGKKPEIKEAIKKETEDLKQMQKKTQKLIKDINKQEGKLKNLGGQPNLNPKVKSAIGQHEQAMESYKNALKDVNTSLNTSKQALR